MRPAPCIVYRPDADGNMVAVGTIKPSPRAPRPMTKARACALHQQAHDWPRHGADWPLDAEERRAADWLADHPDILEALW